MFNALVMSYSRLPLAMAQDGMLPKVFGKTHPKTRAPGSRFWSARPDGRMCLGLGFERLVTIDILLYGASLCLEFVTLVVLRIREPELKRSFRVPGGLVGAILAGVFPLALISLAMVRSERETVLGMNGLLFGAIIIVSGFVVYLATGKLRSRHQQAPGASVRDAEPAT